MVIVFIRIFECCYIFYWGTEVEAINPKAHFPSGEAVPWNGQWPGLESHGLGLNPSTATW